MHLEVEWHARGPRRRLGRIEERLDDPQGMLRHLLPELHDYEAEVFATEGHGEWAPNAAGTLETKGSGRVLVNTGALMADLTGGRGDVSGETLSVGTSKAYAGYLRDGARGMPRRNPTPTPDNGTVREWGTHLLTYVVDGRG